MTSPRSCTLDVPGARIHYEVRGRGPVLALVHGGAGDAGVFDRIAPALATRFTVVVPDRRGHSRSPLERPGSTPRVAEHSEDLRRLLDAVTEEPALVYGSSSGAVVALDLLARHPERVRTVVAHEPPLIELLPDAAVYRRLFADVRVTFRRQGVATAMGQFLTAVGLVGPGWRPPAPEELPPALREMMARMAANEPFFLEHELPEVTGYLPDAQALRAVADRLLLAVGSQSGQQMAAVCCTALARTLGRATTQLPGGHTGYVEDGVDFAGRLAELLAAPGDIPRPL
ncbi:alpha/beta hydrolase [Streptomyces sp. NPDC020742]|uniref:alpha/beta fold hydrolase n=1 Tax=Streptomyces sp. NPDC020742 TaxID=3154897 RepID=UPI0033E4C00E